MHNLYDSAKTKSEKNITSIDTLAIVNKKEPEKKKIDSTVRVLEQLEKEGNPTKIEKEEISTNKPYLVLVGSFGKLTNAQKMLKRVERKGLNGIIKKIGSLHRVIIASSLSEQDAIAVKNQHKKTFGEVPYVLKQ